MSQSISLLTLSVVSAGAIARGRAVTFAGAQVSAAGAKAIGIATWKAEAAGEDLPVAVCGTVSAEAGGAFNKGDALACDAQGRLVAASALAIATGSTPVTSTAANGTILAGGILPQFVVADALEGSGGAGSFVEVLLRR